MRHRARRRASAGEKLFDLRVIEVSALLLLTLAACARSSDAGASSATPSPIEPVYYVDGARPSPGLNTAPDMSEDEYLAGCVPWSKDRPDVHVCGPVPDSFEPPPPLGGSTDYPAVCERAAAIFDERVEGLMDAYSLAAKPVLDAGSCGAEGVGSMTDGVWMAKFSIGNADEVPPYFSVLVRGSLLRRVLRRGQ